MFARSQSERRSLPLRSPLEAEVLEHRLGDQPADQVGERAAEKTASCAGGRLTRRTGSWMPPGTLVAPILNGGRPSWPDRHLRSIDFSSAAC